MERLSELIYSPDHFPQLAQAGQRSDPVRVYTSTRQTPDGQISQSELDWAYARRALARGESPQSVIAAIANHRRGEKSNPEQYAGCTVRKAVQSLADTPHTEEISGPDR